MKILFVVLWGLLRRDKFRKWQELNKSQWLPLSELKRLQNNKFINLINHCKKNVPYYRAIDAIHAVKSLDDITKLPFLSKKDILENQESLKAVNYPTSRFIPNSTGGSSGMALTFFSDSNNIMSLGLLVRSNAWAGWRVGERQAMLWGSHYDISIAGKLSNKIKNWCFHKKLFLSSFDMTDEDMLRYQAKINKFKPQLITGYPSGLFTFASFLEAKGLDIYQPKGIIASGETLYKYQKEKIETVFKCKVLNRYGCREVGNIAHECEKQNGLHINAEHVFVEVVDEDGKPCKPGELGEIVVTDLDNYVFPFIRYKIGDIGKLSEKMCGCGRGLPLLESVEGRTFDVIVGTNGNYITGNFWTILLRTYVKGVKQFQVIQEEKDRLLFKLVVNEQFDEIEKRKFINKVHEKCGDDINIDIEFVEKIFLTKSGKHKFVVSKISPFVS